MPIRAHHGLLHAISIHLNEGVDRCRVAEFQGPQTLGQEAEVRDGLVRGGKNGALQCDKSEGSSTGNGNRGRSNGGKDGVKAGFDSGSSRLVDGAGWCSSAFVEERLNGLVGVLDVDTPVDCEVGGSD